jgi:hypothetical protein
MTHSIRLATVNLGAVLLASAYAPAAMAGCGASAQPGLHHKAAFQTDSGDHNGLIQLAAYNGSSIVGLWSVSFMVGSTQIDFGYGEWHSDGTEFFNSGGLAPATQNYCLGVWKQVGVNSYKLNHWALSFDNTGTLNARVNIKEAVKLNHNASAYAGTFSIQAYDPNTGDPIGPETDGNITGTRITVD